jgi:hypothetical protein
VILEFIHGTKRLSTSTIPDSGAVPRQGDHLHFISGDQDDTGAYRVEFVSWVAMVNGGVLKAILFLSAVDPELLPRAVEN